MIKNYSKPAIYAPSADNLLSIQFKLVLINLLASSPMSALDMADWMAALIFGYDGPIYGHDGRQIEITESMIDDAFWTPRRKQKPYEDFIESFSWIDDQRKEPITVPKRRSQRRILKRLELFYIVFAIYDQRKLTH